MTYPFIFYPASSGTFKDMQWVFANKFTLSRRYTLETLFIECCWKLVKVSQIIRGIIVFCRDQTLFSEADSVVFPKCGLGYRI